MLTTLLLCEKLISIAVVLQTTEMLQMRDWWSETGVWKWSILRQDFEGFPSPLRTVFDRLLSEKGFRLLLKLMRIAGLLVFVWPGASPVTVACLFFLFFGTLLTAMRFRGSFNGGSDSMTLLVLSFTGLGILFAKIFPSLASACLWFMAIQVCLSFAISGWIKFKSPSWMTGNALMQITRVSNYGPPAWAERLFSKSPRLFCWLVVGFELSFPFALLSHQVATVYIATALIFHFINYLLFGLNRFFFAWLAAYPAFYYCAR